MLGDAGTENHKNKCGMIQQHQLRAQALKANSCSCCSS
jgi:hypothetical protein